MQRSAGYGLPVTLSMSWFMNSVLRQVYFVANYCCFQFWYNGRIFLH